MSEHIIRTNEDDSVIVIVDMQERLVPAMYDRGSLIDACVRLVRGGRHIGIPVIFTQQYTKGLGQTITEVRNAATVALTEIVKNVKSAAEDPIESSKPDDFEYIDKKSFSILGEPNFVEALKQKKRRTVILAGVEAHVCVLQSALDFISQGYDVVIAEDAIRSRKPEDMKPALRRLAQSGATISTSEAILFDLIKGADHPAFKQVSATVK
ncbi:MAG: isochorismatase family protein [Clostridiales Family XIII bacterium]|jgi:nicotinamidase-related amidase|nr:isochorismatase family protein [Clostridiales Family XIII bacterium]